MSDDHDDAAPGELERTNPRERRVAGRRVVWIFLMLGAALIGLSTATALILIARSAANANLRNVWNAK